MRTCARVRGCVFVVLLFILLYVVVVAAAAAAVSVVVVHFIVSREFLTRRFGSVSPRKASCNSVELPNQLISNLGKCCTLFFSKITFFFGREVFNV